MLKLILLNLLLPVAMSTTIHPVLDVCEVTTNEPILHEVHLDKDRLFIYLKKGEVQGNAVIQVKDTKKDRVYMRIITDCEKGTVKVSHKTKAGWENIVKDKPFICAEEMIVMYSSYKAELWLGDGAPIAWQWPGDGELSVSGDVTVTNMAAGQGCILYPLDIKTCPEAESWFMEMVDNSCTDNQGLSTTAGKGVFNCNRRPRCQGELFDPVQQLDMRWFGCTTPDGTFTHKYVSTDIEEAEKICNEQLNN